MKNKNVEGQVITYSDTQWNKLYLKYRMKYMDSAKTNVMAEMYDLRDFKNDMKAIQRDFAEGLYKGKFTDADAIRIAVKKQDKSMSGTALVNFRANLNKGDHPEDEVRFIKDYFAEVGVDSSTQLNRKQLRELYDIMRERFEFTSEEWQAYFNS